MVKGFEDALLVVLEGFGVLGALFGFTVEVGLAVGLVYGFAVDAVVGLDLVVLDLLNGADVDALFEGVELDLVGLVVKKADGCEVAGLVEGFDVLEGFDEVRLVKDGALLLFGLAEDPIVCPFEDALGDLLIKAVVD